MILLTPLLQQAVDAGGGAASKLSDGTILTAILGLTTTIFGALTLNQKSQVDGLKGIIADCRSGRDEDIKYERQARASAEAKEDKCLDRLAGAVSSAGDLSTAVRENATVGTAIVQEVRNHATRVDAIIRTQEGMGRDISDHKKILDDVKRSLDDLRYRRGSGGGDGSAD